MAIFLLADVLAVPGHAKSKEGFTCVSDHDGELLWYDYTKRSLALSHSFADVGLWWLEIMWGLGENQG